MQGDEKRRGDAAQQGGVCVKRVIADNLSALRRAAGMTQSELAAALNYTDKAVSKWERGESAPDIEVLKRLADMFGVTLDYLVSDSHGQEKPAVSKNRMRVNRIMIALLSAATVWLVATVIFTILGIVSASVFGLEKWLVFLYAVPATCVVLLVFNCLWGRRVLNAVIISVLMWSMLTALYLTFLPHNIWLIFIIGIPGQLVIILSTIIKPPASI